MHFTNPTELTSAKLCYFYSKMSLPKSFYKGVIFCSAKKIREKDIFRTGSEEWQTSAKSAAAYISSTERILAIFADNTEKLWDLQSIQEKMGNHVDVELILDALVEYKFIEVITNDENIDTSAVKLYRYAKDRTGSSWTFTVVATSVVASVIAVLIYENYTLKDSSLDSKPLTKTLVNGLINFHLWSMDLKYEYGPLIGTPFGPSFTGIFIRRYIYSNK